MKENFILPPLQLYNTLSKTLESFEPIEPNKVRMYVCGPTVYDEPHLGHARCYLTWDILYRFLKFLNYDVTYVRNITDVDDKIINRAKDRNVTTEVITQENTKAFHDAMAQLNILSPDVEPHATDSIPEMFKMIEGLIGKGFAYVTPDGSVYYRTEKKQDYGKLCHQNLDDLKSGARIDVDTQKENPLDFVLWKSVTEAETVFWKSPWGKGRPGWHIECSAMIHKVFGFDQIDIHAGGYDLVFPHHENEIAQSEAYSGQAPFVKYWLHNGFVNVSGEKMSKSLGNFTTIKGLLEAYDADTIRYFILTNKYRQPVDFSEEALDAAKNWVNKTHDRIDKIIFSLSSGSESVEVFLRAKVFPRGDQQVQELKTNWLQAMSTDLNTAEALGAINGLLKLARSVDMDKNIRLEAFEVFIELSSGLGFKFDQYEISRPDFSSNDVIEKLIDQRTEAKANKDWAKADEIRNQVTALGYKLIDQKDGPTTYEPL